MKYRIGTRGSRLALAQAECVRNRLAAAYPDDEFETVVLKTVGDKVVDRPIESIGPAAPFAKEIEEALLDGRVDLAVHSMKDLAAKLPEGLVLAKAWTRADARDALVVNGPWRSLGELPQGARVATGSVRRNAFLRRARPDLEIVGIRGNVDTRLRKLFDPKPDEPRLDALVLAAAGLKRLGRGEVITRCFEPGEMVPAPNQGQLAVELRAADAELKAKVDALGDDFAETAAEMERGFLIRTGADCSRPVGAYARLEDGRLVLYTAEGGAGGDLPVERTVAGEVALVGAGPGAPDLITLRGLSALEEADAVVYDRLVSEELLKHVRKDCELVYVGKESGHHTLPQDEINALLLKTAMRHRRVVRLKGGDPFVFGRGGEEMAYLVARGVPCRAVPGVTSAVAAAESAGIPVTQRGVASGFQVLTAHPGAARRPDTLVYLMGSDRIAALAQELVAEGKSPSTPAAVVSSATTDRERCIAGTLADMGEKAVGALSPAVFVVGDVVDMRRKLGFPLSGRRFLIPVLEGGSRSLSGRIRALGGEADEVVVGRIVPIPGAVKESDLDGATRIVLTSANGRLGLAGGIAEAAAKRGIPVESVREVKPVGRTLHFTQPDAERVEGVVSIDVYRNEPVPVDRPIDLSRYDGLLLTCGSSARRILAVSKGTTRIYAIGAKTAASARAAGAESVVVAPEPNLSSLVVALNTQVFD